MPYIGRSEKFGVRNRFYYTQASGGATSISGNDDAGKGLSFTDGAYVDVALNGVTLVAGTDYNTTTANTIAGLSALSAGDIIEILVYDVFNVADTVSATSGGTFTGGVTMESTLAVSGATTITTADNSTQLTLKSTDADAAAGPRFDLIRDSASPADGDNIGRIRYMFDNDAAEQTEGVRLDGVLVDVTDGTEDVSYAISTLRAGTLAESMRVDHAGGIRINTTTQLFNNIGNEKLSVEGGTTGQAASFSTSTSGGFPAMYVRNTLSGTVNAIIFHQGSPSAAVGSITMAGGSSTSFNTSSDYRLKENVNYTWDATTRLKQLKPARFNFIIDADTTVDGFLAHEVQTVVPEAITGTKDEVDADGNPVMQGIDQSKLVPLLVKTIQELEARITALEAG